MAKAKKTASPVDIEVVIDRSGSMGIIANDAIGGYNTWLTEQKKLPGEALLTLTLFDHEHILKPTVPLALATPLDTTSYVPRGSTALNDAIGQAVMRLFGRNPEKAILVILTDGQENASREFNSARVKELITQAQGRGWQVVYLSADANAFTHAAMYGVAASNTVKFTADAAGTAAVFRSATLMNTGYRNGDDTMVSKPDEAETK